MSPARTRDGLRIAGGFNLYSAYRQIRGKSNSRAARCRRLQTGNRATKSRAMRPTQAQIRRVAEALTRRLVQAQVLELDAPEATVRDRFASLLEANFAEEAAIEREAEAEAARLVRRGAPGIRREELDLRKVEQLVKQRLARARGFTL
jgi:hypothetical protein